MMKLFSITLIFLILFISCEQTNKKNTIENVLTDDIGNSFKFDKVPKRVISLAPNITEMIFDLCLDDKLVGSTLYCYYPQEAQKIEKVGDMITFNFEKIVSLKPDLIFITVEGNTKDTYDKFRELGLTIFVSNPRNYEGIKKTYLDLATIFQIKQTASEKVTDWDSLVAKSRKLKFDIEKTAMLLIETKPIMLVGKNTFLNEYLLFNNLKNIADDSPLNYPMFSREEVLKRNPDYIIYTSGGGETINDLISIYPEWKKLNAVKNNNIIFIDRDLYSRPGPRFAEAVYDLSTRLHRSD